MHQIEFAIFADQTEPHYVEILRFSSIHTKMLVNVQIFLAPLLHRRRRKASPSHQGNGHVLTGVLDIDKKQQKLYFLEFPSWPVVKAPV